MRAVISRKAVPTPSEFGHSDPLFATLPGQKLGNELLAFSGNFGDLL